MVRVTQSNETIFPSSSVHVTEKLRRLENHKKDINNNSNSKDATSVFMNRSIDVFDK